MRVLFTLIFMFVVLPISALAQEVTGTSLTIYSSAAPGSIQPHLYRPTPGGQSFWGYNSIPGYAVVRNQRNINLGSARTQVRADDVAALIDPTTVTFKSLTDPEGTTVLEQNYHFDLVSLNKLAERYIGKTISFEKRKNDTETEIISGKLLNAQNGQLVVQRGDGSVVTTYAKDAIFPKLPGELYTKPTLMWDILTNKPAQTHKVETSYETGGMTWWTDYNAVYRDGKDANNGMLDIGAWVTIINKSGASYPNSKLKLIAGNVQKAGGYGSGGGVRRGDVMMMEAAPMDKGFSEKSFFEYHLYTLGRKTSLPENSTKQVELFQKATNVPVKKLMIYEGSKNIRYYGGINYNKDFGANGNKKVDVYLKFKNSKENNMGMPLPAGRVRVNKVDDADGTQEFIGEDIIDHTPKNEDVLLRLGSAFDVVGERKQVDYQIDYKRKWMQETFEIIVKNHKEQDVKVIIRENLYRGNQWKMLSTSQKYEKINSQTIEFPVTITANGKVKLRYSVEYKW
jgi:hypothetical protein